LQAVKHKATEKGELKKAINTYKVIKVPDVKAEPKLP
jgi:hypothetical protein